MCPDSVQWQDGDASGRLVSYNLVAMNLPPEADEIAIGTKVVFPQGRYRFGRSLGMRYHLGVVNSIMEHSSGAKRYYGNHASPPGDKRLPFPEYSFEFLDFALGELRLPPNAFDTLVNS
jgi:hypothetical protein